MDGLSSLRADRRRLKNAGVLAFVVALLNLPILYATWTNGRVQGRGVDVTATVTAARNLGTAAEPRWWVSYRLPEEVDPDRITWAAEVDRPSWSAAERSGTIEVRVLEGQPSRHTASGEVRSRAGLWSTLAADAVLGLVLLVVWRLRRGSPRTDS